MLRKCSGAGNDIAATCRSASRPRSLACPFALLCRLHFFAICVWLHLHLHLLLLLLLQLYLSLPLLLLLVLRLLLLTLLHLALHLHLLLLLLLLILLLVMLLLLLLLHLLLHLLVSPRMLLHHHHLSLLLSLLVLLPLLVLLLLLLLRGTHLFPLLLLHEPALLLVFLSFQLFLFSFLYFRGRCCYSSGLPYRSAAGGRCWRGCSRPSSPPWAIVVFDRRRLSSLRFACSICRTILRRRSSVAGSSSFRLSRHLPTTIAVLGENRISVGWS